MELQVGCTLRCVLAGCRVQQRLPCWAVNTPAASNTACRWLAADEHHPGADVPLGSSIVQRLQRFGTYGRLKRAALHAIARFVPPVGAPVYHKCWHTCKTAARFH